MSLPWPLLQCPSLANCKTYLATDCSCKECNTFFSPSKGACQVGNNRVQSCEVLGYRAAAGVAGAPTEMQTAQPCLIYFGIWIAQCAVAATGCDQKNSDGCSCKKCSNGYKLAAAGGSGWDQPLVSMLDVLGCPSSLRGTCPAGKSMHARPPNFCCSARKLPTARPTQQETANARSAPQVRGRQACSGDAA